MHPDAYEAVATRLAANVDTSASLRVLDCGGLDVNSSLLGLSLRPLLPAATWTVLDIAPLAGVDVIADIRTWQPQPAWDVVLSTEMLEHLDGWQKSIGVMAGALDPDGPEVLIITCAGPNRQPHDAYGGPVKPPDQYYENIISHTLRSELEKHFASVEVTENDNPSDLYAIGKGVIRDLGTHSDDPR